MGVALLSQKSKESIGDEKLDWRVLAVFFSALCCFAVAQGRFANIASVAVFFGFFFYLFVTRPAFLIKYLVFIFGAAINVAGVLVCEVSEIYLSELGIQASYAGSVPLLALSRWLFFLVLLSMDARTGCENDRTALNASSSQGRVFWLDIAVICVALIYFIMLIGAVRFPPAFFGGLDRFDWQTRYGGNQILPNLLMANARYLVVIPLTGLSKGERRISGLGLAFYCLFLLWTGEKFGGLFVVLYTALWVFYERLIAGGKDFLYRVVAGSIAGLVVLVCGATVVQSAILGSNSGNQTAYLTNRLAQQGQLWWRTYSVADGDCHFEEFSNEIEMVGKTVPLAKTSVGSDIGIYKIMYLCAPKSTIDAKLSSGSTYTESGYAAMYYYFGPIGPIAHSVILGFLISLMVNGLIRAVRIPISIDAVILLRLTIEANTALGMFTSGLVGKFSLFSLAYLLVASIARELTNKRGMVRPFIRWKSNRSSRSLIASKKHSQSIISFDAFG